MKKYVLIVILLLLVNCAPRLFHEKWTAERAPDQFSVAFETSKGPFEIEVSRNLSPKAVDRFYQLVKHNYFNNQLFYRVNPGFVAQFGSSNKKLVDDWATFEVPDEDVVQGNEKGTLSFGRGGPNTRTADLYINLSDNHRLDTILYNGVKGFPTFGKVTKGMKVLESLYAGYADTTMDTLQLMYRDREQFLKLFPKLDTIHKVRITK